MRVVAITGGATGIGAAIRQQLLEEGCRVIMVDIRDADVEADLSSLEGRQQAIDGIRAAAPDGLDGFVPCAGLGPHVTPHSLVTRVNYWRPGNAGRCARVAGQASGVCRADLIEFSIYAWVGCALSGIAQNR